MRSFVWVMGGVFVFSSALAAPGVEILDSRTEKFAGPELSALMKVESYRIRLEGIDHYGTRMALEYKTQQVADLEKYAVVQFFRGCQFGSTSESKTMNVVRELFGESVLFQAKQWQVDSDDLDPMYNSPQPDESGLIRHHYYRWSKNPDLFTHLDQVYYGVQQPQIPALHVTDRPGQAWYDSASGVADNISLEFKACLYRTIDIPRVSTPEKIEMGTPIHCFPWRSSFVLNHRTKKMESPASIDSFCQASSPDAR